MSCTQNRLSLIKGALVKSAFFTSALLLASTQAALAQPGGPPPAPIQPGAAPAPSDVDPGVLADPNADRAWFMPTALTQPAGSFSFNDYELFLMGVTYGVTDQLQLSASTIVPLAAEQPLTLFASGKIQVVKQSNLRIAAYGSTWFFADSNGNDSANVGFLGAVATVCLDPECHSTVSGSAAAGFAAESNDDTIPIIVSGSIVQRVGASVKLVGEIDTGFVFSGERADGYIGWYGARFFSSSIAGDIGFIKPFGPEFDDDDVFPIGLPWINFTYRG